MTNDAARLTAPDGLKMLRETLCVAQNAVSRGVDPRDRRDEHSRRLQALIDQVDVLRPLGHDGKHGDLHTPWCGCEG
jgi:hypothetical protein